MHKKTKSRSACKTAVCVFLKARCSGELQLLLQYNGRQKTATKGIPQSDVNRVDRQPAPKANDAIIGCMPHLRANKDSCVAQDGTRSRVRMYLKHSSNLTDRYRA